MRIVGSPIRWLRAKFSNKHTGYWVTITMQIGVNGRSYKEARQSIIDEQVPEIIKSKLQSLDEHYPIRFKVE